MLDVDQRTGRGADGELAYQRSELARVSREPVTEQIFTECFGFGYADLLDRLSDYIPVAVTTPVRLTLSPSPAASRLDLKPATLVQIARLRKKVGAGMIRTIRNMGYRIEQSTSEGFEAATSVEPCLSSCATDCGY